MAAGLGRARPVSHRAADRDGSPRERRYVLDMFPYPSGDLHMGHAEAYAFGDVVARYWQQRGYDVLHPIGWDSFGLPAENAAIDRNQHPADWTYANIETQAASFRRYGMSFDWSRRLHTCDPEYYRWTQWLFLRFFERGLAYRKASAVNWCPNDQTVLANEQVIDGQCERCGTLVTKKTLTQWYFKITEYADRLLDDMARTGRFVARPGADHAAQLDRPFRRVRTSTSRSRAATSRSRFSPPGPTRCTARPSSSLPPTRRWPPSCVRPNSATAFDAYVEQVRRPSDIERLSTERAKTGVFLGRYAINPVNGERIPVWAADYVLADYGTGAIMAVPAHDQRDLDFARHVRSAGPHRRRHRRARPGGKRRRDARRRRPCELRPLDGLDKADAHRAHHRRARGQDGGKGAINYRLRDWLLSRQRFWGAPIPIVHCAVDGEVPVPDDQLPVRLPDLRGADLRRRACRRWPRQPSG